MPLVLESLNLGDVFILDLGKEILVWCPPKSGRLERIKGIRQATNIRDQERAGRGEIEVLGRYKKEKLIIFRYVFLRNPLRGRW